MKTLKPYVCIPEENGLTIEVLMASIYALYSDDEFDNFKSPFHLASESAVIDPQKLKSSSIPEIANARSTYDRHKAYLKYYLPAYQLAFVLRTDIAAFIAICISDFSLFKKMLTGIKEILKIESNENSDMFFAEFYSGIRDWDVLSHQEKYDLICEYIMQEDAPNNVN